MTRSARGPCLPAFIALVLFFPSLFFALEHDRTVTLRLDMEAHIDSPTTGEVYWKSDDPYFWEAKVVRFRSEAGRRQYLFSIPSDLRQLRIDPIDEKGQVTVDSIALEIAPHLAVRRWDRATGFVGWRAAHDLRDFKAEDGQLRMVAVGSDPFFESTDLAALNLPRWVTAAHLVLAFLFALLASIAQTRAIQRTHEKLVPILVSQAQGIAGTWVENLKLSVISVLLCATAGYLIYAKWGPKHREPNPAQSEGGDRYSLVLVDRRGRQLSPKGGSLKLMLDPFTFYRNLPGQRTSAFNTDEMGFRVSSSAREGRATHAVFLGGSAAFGQGLDSDQDTIPSRLNQLDQGYAFTNAGVCGFLAGQEAAMMAHYTDQLRPRLYVAFDGWNDEYVDLFRDLTSRELGFNLRFFSQVEDRLFQLTSTELQPGSPALDPSLPEPSFDEKSIDERIFKSYSGNLRRMALAARTQGARFLAVFQPEPGAKLEPTRSEAAIVETFRKDHAPFFTRFTERYRELGNRTRSFCTREKIDCLNMNSEPELQGVRTDTFLDLVHLNANGTRIAAELIQKHLDRRDFADNARDK